MNFVSSFTRRSSQIQKTGKSTDEEVCTNYVKCVSPVVLGRQEEWKNKQPLFMVL